jgi:hypothetical protein
VRGGGWWPGPRGGWTCDACEADAVCVVACRPAVLPSAQEVTRLRAEVEELGALKEANAKLKSENEALADLLSRATGAKLVPAPAPPSAI